MSDGPVDPTATEAWSRLTALADGFAPDLRAWFAADPDRVASFRRLLAARSVSDY